MLVTAMTEPLNQLTLGMGRDPEGNAKTKEMFALLGTEWLAAGVDDGPKLAQGLSQFFTYRMATTLKQVRAIATHAKLNEAYASLELDTVRWEFMTASLSEFLALDFVTPVASAGLPPPTGETKSGCRGGHRTERLTLDDNVPIGAQLQAVGRLQEPHFFAKDYAHLNLPLVLKPSHKVLITTRNVEMIAERQGSLKMDAIFAAEITKQVTELLGPMPMNKKEVAKALESAENVIAGGSELFVAKTWGDATWWKLRNIKKTKAGVRPLPFSPCT